MGLPIPAIFGEIICDLIGTPGPSRSSSTALVPTYHMDFIAVLNKTAEPDLAASRALVDRVSAVYRAPSYERKMLNP